MSYGRQNPEYETERSVEDALAIMTAFLQPELDDDLIEVALRNALEVTDHTVLTYNLGLIMRVVVSIAAGRANLDPRALAREVATATAAAMLGPDQD